LIIGLACSMAGGFVSAKIAGHDELLNGALSSILCVTLGIYQLARGHADYQPFVQMLMMLASPTFALLSGYFRLRQKSASLKTG
jgi:MFS superfamily sulfate permease-like transporter